MVLGGTGSVRALLVDTWWYWGTMGRYWLVFGVTGSVRALLVDTWWYWVTMGRYWLVFGGTGSVEGGTGWYLVVLGE